MHKKQLRDEAEVFFWRNAQNEEVDFVVREGLKVVDLIQVCRDLSDTKTLNRETRALLKAGSELKCRNLTILTDGEEKEAKAEWFGLRGLIRHVPLWKWLAERGR